MTSLGLLVLLLAQPADPAPLVVLPPTAVGLDAAGTEAAARRIATQASALGLAVERRKEGPAEGCLDDDACRSGLVSGKAGLLAVELLRFGPEVTVTARLYDERGTLLATSERSLAHEAFSAAPELLGDEVAAALRALAVERATAAPPGPMAQEDTHKGPASTVTAEKAAPGTTSLDESEGPNVLGLSLTGVAAAAGLGGLVIVGSGVGSYFVAQQILNDRLGTTAQKDSMLIVRYVGAGMVVAGLLVVAASGAGAGASTLFW